MSFFGLKKRAESAQNNSSSMKNLPTTQQRNVTDHVSIYKDTSASIKVAQQNQSVQNSSISQIQIGQVSDQNQKRKIQDLQQSMTINKEIIRTLIEAQNKAGDLKVKHLMEVLEKMRQENSILHEKIEGSQSARKTDKASDQKLIINELNQKLGLITAQIKGLSQIFLELLSISTFLSQKDPLLVNKVQEITQKFKSFKPQLGQPDIDLKFDTLKLQGQLQAALAEIEQLKQGAQQQTQSQQVKENRISFQNTPIKPSEVQQTIKTVLNTAACRSPVSSSNQASEIKKLAVPKLDLKNVNVDATKRPTDWQAYSVKLEEALKYQRQQVKMFETDNEELTNKLRNENKKLNEALQINQRLLGVLNTTKEKYSQLKKRNKSHCSSSESLGFGMETTINDDADLADNPYIGGDVPLYARQFDSQTKHQRQIKLINRTEHSQESPKHGKMLIPGGIQQISKHRKKHSIDAGLRKEEFRY